VSDDLDALRAAVLGWYRAVRRDLPWRRTTDPYAILVSEVMLQQTQVSRVIPKWTAFLTRFPTPADCAAVELGEVLRHWHGLGYPRRAGNLHAAARLIAAAGRFPSEFADLLALPGVGPYTARAVLVFAFEADVAVVDTNIARVLARIAGRRLTPREVQSMADGLLPVGQAWRWNQSLMDLGALLCRPAPSCAECPWDADCAFHGAGADPATGSAGVSTRQPRFAGSRREARGRMLARLLAGPAAVTELAAVAGWAPEEAAELLAGLVAEGLVVADGGTYRVP
jgi:A/G-specific adenine glycosylase